MSSFRLQNERKNREERDVFCSEWVWEEKRNRKEKSKGEEINKRGERAARVVQAGGLPIDFHLEANIEAAAEASMCRTVQLGQEPRLSHSDRFPFPLHLNSVSLSTAHNFFQENTESY